MQLTAGRPASNAVTVASPPKALAGGPVQTAFLEDYFESDVILAHYSGGSIIGTGLGVHSPGTAYVLLHHAMGDVDGNIGAWGFARGGMGSVSGALASSFRSLGGDVRTDAEVTARADHSVPSRITRATARWNSSLGKTN